MVDGSISERPAKVLQTALAVALVCALLVSFAAVSLRPHYLANLEAERKARLALILDALKGVTSYRQLDDIEARVVDLESGAYSDTTDPNTYDARRAANDPNTSITIPAQYDVAAIKRRARFAVVYLLRNADNKIEGLILPVRGVGYQSALYGYLALAADANEILALKFYEQGETPGLGSEIQDPAWEAQWPGKQSYDADGKPSVQFDAISGATRTSVGVDRLLHFWLGDFGFGPYLKRVREGDA